MRIVIQNVLSSQVTINDEIVSTIGRGFLLFVGFTHGDTEDTARWMADKALSLRVFADERGLTNKCIQDIKGEIMSVSQFTLYANVKGGRRPSFTDAMPPLEATKLYDYFNTYLASKFGKIEKGVFGADMKVSLTNDGPFTMLLDSKELYER